MDMVCQLVIYVSHGPWRHLTCQPVLCRVTDINTCVLFAVLLSNAAVDLTARSVQLLSFHKSLRTFL